MRSIAYTRYNGEDLDISAEDLMKALADFLLDSGFNDPYFQYGANTLDDLRNAIEYAMANGDLGDRIRDQYEGMSPEQIEQALDQFVRHRTRTEPAHIAAPGDQLGQLRPKILVERRWRRGRCRLI